MLHNEIQAHNKRSARANATLALVIGFVAVFALLYSTFSIATQQNIVEIENAHLYSQAERTRGMLLASLHFLPNITRDFTRLNAAQNYAPGDTVYETCISDALASYKLNMVALLDANNLPVFERFYDYEAQAYAEAPDDFQSFYNDITPGTSGFMGQDGAIYFISSASLLPSDAYTLVFGRRIDENALMSMGNNASLSLLTGEMLPEADPESVHFVRIDAQAAYSVFNDIHGNPLFAVATSDPAPFHPTPLDFPAVAFAALSCIIVMLSITYLLDERIIKPMVTLGTMVNALAMDNIQETVAYRGNSREIGDLAHSINTMRTRIQTDQNLIRKSNESLHQHTNFDLLTGLRNRASMAKVMASVLGSAASAEECVMVFCLDLDRFKYINDTLGYQLGDVLITQIVQRMKETLDDDVILARMGGDSFLACVKAADDSERVLFARKMLSLLTMPFHIEDNEIVVTASMGSSTFPEDGRDVETLIKNAEIAMYRAKEPNEPAYVPYHAEFQSSLKRKMDIEARLRTVIAYGCAEFQVYFQPKVSVRTGQIHHCEALIRWISPTGIIGPMEFIPQAEETGLIVPLTWWVIAECCRQGRRFADAGMPMSISINVSAQVLMHDDFLRILQDAVRETGMDIRHLDIEITEGTLLKDVERVNAVLHALHSMGVEVSVDDFGTGYSSLSYLTKLAVDRIKVDRSFVSGIAHDEDSRAIVRAIVAMGKSLHMLITAEGVETEDQYDFLRNIVCDEVQGYMISRPIPAERYIEFIQEWNGLEPGRMTS